jgi:hypothetical protein
MSKIEHTALAEFFISSVTTVLVPSALWLMYSFKIVEFNRRAISFNQNEFIHSIRALGNTLLLFNLFTVAVMELLPVIAYGSFLIAVAWQHHQTYVGICLILIITTIICIVTFFLYRSIAKSVDYNTQWKLTELWNKHFQRSFPQISLEWIVRNEFFLLAGNKIFSLLMIIGTSALYQYDTYDLRLMAMGMTIAMASHAMLIHRYQRFVEDQFFLVRNLPLSLTKRMSYFLKIFFMVCLPDFGVLIKNFPDQLSSLQLAESFLLAAGIILFMFGYYYLKSVTADRLIAHVFVFALALIILILFSASVWLLGAILIAFGIAIYFSRYYHFDLRPTTVIKNLVTCR